MKNFSPLSVAEQLASHLREEILRGNLSGTMPSVRELRDRLGISPQTVTEALKMLEQEGLLESQGPGRRSRIVPPKRGTAKSRLRVALLLWNVTDRAWPLILELRHQLDRAGHTVVDPPLTLVEMKMDVQRVAQLVKKTKAGAWIVVAGGIEVMQWFARQEFPVFAIYGRYGGLPVAAVGPDPGAPISEVIRHLISLGHVRIVMLLRRQHRQPVPAATVLIFLETLKAHGIKESPFWLPDWKETREGLQECLESLFRWTPPTALIVDEPELFTAVMLFLTARGIRCPRDVSLVCMADGHDYAWCVPSVAHIRTNLSSLVRPVLRWAKHVSQGKEDIRQDVVKLDYVHGGTVGPVPREG